MNMKIILLTFVFIPLNVFACSYISPNTINMGISLENKMFFTYDSKTVQDTIGSVEINNCGKAAAAKQYLMLSFGPEYVSFQDNILGTNYNRVFPEINRCEFVNSPFEKLTTYDERKKVFDKKWEFISKCIDINVIELGPNPLVIPAMQEGCTIKSTSPQSAKFNGGYCFIKPSKDSNFNVSLSIANDCLNLYGYTEFDLHPQDINFNLGAYTSLTFQDTLDDLTQVGSTPVRISVNPVKGILKPSDDYGIIRPTFNANFEVQDLHLGKIAFNNPGGSDLLINVPFVVNNSSCKRNIYNGVSNSACDYATPFVGEITLRDEAGHEILTWLDGGVASSNWQGIITGLGTFIHKDLIPTNKAYSLDVNFSDPKYYYNLFRHKYSTKIGSITTRIPRISNSGTIADLGEINTINNSNEMIYIDPINGINLNDKSILSLKNNLFRLNSYFSSSMFPPTYDQVCNNEGKCIDSGNVFVKFKAKFYLNSDYTISKLEVNRISNLIGTYIKTSDLQPDFICN